MEHLCYIEDGHLPIVYNRAENANRSLVIGRKNRLFSDAPKGATANAQIYSQRWAAARLSKARRVERLRGVAAMDLCAAGMAVEALLDHEVGVRSG